MIERLFTQALGLVAPWQVKQVDFNREAGRIDFGVTFGSSRHVCPACGAAAQPFHDRLARSWRHLDFFQYKGLPACRGTASGVLGLREGDADSRVVGT